MNYFLNYENGEVTVNSYRHPSAIATTVEDIIEALRNGEEDALVASLSSWVEDNINDMWGKVPNGLSEKQISEFVFVENNFTEQLVNIGIDVSDLGFAWEAQHDFIEDYLD